MCSSDLACPFFRHIYKKSRKKYPPRHLTWGGGRGILVVEIEQQFQFLKRRFDPHGLAAPRQRPAFPARYGPPKSMLKLKMSNPRSKEPQAIGSLPKRGPRKAALRLCGERSRSEMSERRIKKPPQAIGSLRRRGGGGWIRFSAEKPRAGERATGTSA